LLGGRSRLQPLDRRRGKGGTQTVRELRGRTCPAGSCKRAGEKETLREGNCLKQIHLKPGLEDSSSRKRGHDRGEGANQKVSQFRHRGPICSRHRGRRQEGNNKSGGKRSQREEINGPFRPCSSTNRRRPPKNGKGGRGGQKRRRKGRAGGIQPSAQTRIHQTNQSGIWDKDHLLHRYGQVTWKSPLKGHNPGAWPKELSTLCGLRRPLGKRKAGGPQRDSRPGRDKANSEKWSRVGYGRRIQRRVSDLHTQKMSRIKECGRHSRSVGQGDSNGVGGMNPQSDSIEQK